MTTRKLRLGLALSGLALLAGCTSTTTTMRPSYAQPVQPAIIQTTPVTTAPYAQTAPYPQTPPISVQTPPPGVVVQPGTGAPCPNCVPGQPVPPPPAPVVPR